MRTKLLMIMILVTAVFTIPFTISADENEMNEVEETNENGNDQEETSEEADTDNSESQNDHSNEETNKSDELSSDEKNEETNDLEKNEETGVNSDETEKENETEIFQSLHVSEEDVLEKVSDNFSLLGFPEYSGDESEFQDVIQQFNEYYGYDDSNNLDTIYDRTEEILDTPFKTNATQTDEKTIDIKNKLTRLTYGNMNINDIYGSFTATRVSQFQRDQGLRQNGIVDPPTLNELNDVYRGVFQERNINHPGVEQLKLHLNKLGFGGMNVNTVFGNFTSQRVSEFQDAFDIKVTGYVSEDTFTKIEKLLESPHIVGARSEANIELKEKMTKLGFGGMNINETYGNWTRQQMLNLQKYYGFKQTGLGDSSTLEKIDDLLDTPFKVGADQTSDTTIDIKNKLTRLTYGNMNINDVFGSFTSTRVSQFQRDHDLQQNGIVDPPTMERLSEIYQEVFKERSRNHAGVEQLKQQLNQLGFGGMNINPIFGDYTSQRVSEFQTHFNIEVTGYVTEEMFEMIEELLEGPHIIGARSEKNIELKEKMIKLGFGGMNLNETYGSWTSQQMSNLQRYYGFQPTGIGDPKTLQKIDELLDTPFKAGASQTSEQTVELKLILDKLGYGNMNINDVYGSFTATRVGQFQRDHGLVSNGIADPPTLNKLFAKGGELVTETYTDYNRSIQSMVEDVQWKSTMYPQRSGIIQTGYVHSDFISVSVDSRGNTTYRVSLGNPNSRLNIRKEPTSSSERIGFYWNNQMITSSVQGKEGNWYEIRTTMWYNAEKDEVKEYVNPNNHSRFQHLRLDEMIKGPDDEVRSQLNQLLSGRGILEGRADSFMEAAQRHNVNEIYLISHANLETGNGTSALATGIYVDSSTGKAITRNGNVVTQHSDLRSSERLNAVKVYNMYGIGAIDSSPQIRGAETAFENNWITPEAAIIGGSEWIYDRYLSGGQNTLYKMRWQPNGVRQYATDIAWAVKQSRSIERFYNSLSGYSATFDIVRYKD